MKSRTILVAFVIILFLSVEGLLIFDYFSKVKEGEKEVAGPKKVELESSSKILENQNKVKTTEGSEPKSKSLIEKYNEEEDPFENRYRFEKIVFSDKTQYRCLGEFQLRGNFRRMPKDYEDKIKGGRLYPFEEYTGEAYARGVVIKEEKILPYFKIVGDEDLRPGKATLLYLKLFEPEENYLPDKIFYENAHKLVIDEEASGGPGTFYLGVYTEDIDKFKEVSWIRKSSPEKQDATIRAILDSLKNKTPITLFVKTDFYYPFGVTSAFPIACVIEVVRDEDILLRDGKVDWEKALKEIYDKFIPNENKSYESSPIKTFEDYKNNLGDDIIRLGTVYDITGDGFPEVFAPVFVGADHTQYALFEIKRDRVNMHIFYDENKKPVKNWWDNPVYPQPNFAIAGGVGTDLYFGYIKKEKAVFLATRARHSETKECNFKAYKWNEDYYVFLYDEKLSKEYKEKVCEKPEGFYIVE